MQINGVELEFNFLEENMNRRTAEAFNSVSADAGRSVDEKDMSKQIAIICSSVKNAFDYIFGQGIGEKVCGKENDIIVCTDAFAELVEEKGRQDEMLKVKTERLNRAFGNI